MIIAALEHQLRKAIDRKDQATINECHKQLQQLGKR
jgi:hypothetical protein